MASAEALFWREEGRKMTSFRRAVHAASKVIDEREAKPMRGVLQLVAFPCLLLLSACASLHQPDDEVWRRTSGEKLEYWKDVPVAATEHWPYAWASAAAYQYADESAQHDGKLAPDCPNDEPHALLMREGWSLWEGLPLLRQRSTEMPDYRSQALAIQNAHLRVEVWGNRERKEVVVAFGGTVASRWPDWKSNLHWLLGPFGAEDEYDAITRAFVPIFKLEYARLRALPDTAWLSDPDTKVIATGHSLGGGLAQRFAYEIWFNDNSIPFGKKVYTFDPSPVTGKRSSSSFREHGSETKPFKGLQIHRIYNRGEILASVRSILHWGNPDPDGNEEGQTWLDYRYMDEWNPATSLPIGAIHAHGMQGLACFMKRKLPAGVLHSANVGDS
jgi:Lipase (class 3)